MHYNVAQLLKEPIGSLRSYQLEENFTGLNRSADSMFGPVEMVRVHNGILVRATVKVRSNLICSRCLGEYPTASQLDIEEEFFPTLNPQTGHKMEHPDEGEEAGLIDSNHVLDLTGIINEYIITNLPMKPLCDLDCKGLCQGCGADRNLADCQCENETIDPRWQALANLAKQE